MNKIHVETNIKQMVGEFMDCAQLVSSAEVARTTTEDKEAVELASAWAAHLTEQAVRLSFDEEVGVHPMLALAYLACDIAANVSNMMFQAEAAISTEEDE
jgi:hypothetical protein